MKNPFTPDQPTSAQPTQPSLDSQFNTVSEMRTGNKKARISADHEQLDEELALHLRTAIACRVDATLERTSLATAANFAEATARSGGSQLENATVKELKTNRRKKIGLSMAAIIGVITPVFALTRPTLFAANEQKTAQLVQVSAATDSDRFSVKLFARDPEFRLSTFSSGRAFLDPNQQRGLHLSNGSVWIDVRPVPEEMAGFNPTVGKPVTIGSASGELSEDSKTEQTNVRWTVDEQPIMGYGSLLGPSKAEMLAALGQIRFIKNKLVFERGSSAFSAVQMEVDPNQYGVTLMGAKKQTEYVFYTVATDPSYANDYLKRQTILKRGTRTYYLPPEIDGFSQVTYRFGTGSVNVSGNITRDRLLVFADTISEATPAEWELVLAKDMKYGQSQEEIPSKQVLIDGILDEDNRESANFELVVPPADEQRQENCVTVIFTVKEKDKTSCIAKNSTEPFRLLETFTTDGVTVVYGVDAPDERDNHVVRVTDAAGDVVAEDVTLDQRNFTGRAFGLALPADAVSPFKVELFDFDREWYQTGEELPDTYVRPDSKPLATATVNP